MNDFIVGLIIGGVGSYIMGQLDQSNVYSQQQKSCAANGGVWVSTGTNEGVCNPANCANPCPQENSVLTQYQAWGVPIDLGVPVAAAFVATRSLGGVLGASVGAGAVFLTELGKAFSGD